MATPHFAQTYNQPDSTPKDAIHKIIWMITLERIISVENFQGRRYACISSLFENYPSRKLDSLRSFHRCPYCVCDNFMHLFSSSRDLWIMPWRLLFGSPIMECIVQRLASQMTCKCIRRTSTLEAVAGNQVIVLLQHLPLTLTHSEFRGIAIPSRASMHLHKPSLRYS